MLTLIGIILVIYFLWLVVKPYLLRYAQRKYQEKVNDMFNQAFGTQGRTYTRTYTTGQQQKQRDNSRRSSRYPGRREKIFSRDEGEYIEFEEIEVKTEYRSSTASDSSYTPREPQVSDAEWEEIR